MNRETGEGDGEQMFIRVREVSWFVYRFNSRSPRITNHEP